MNGELLYVVLTLFTWVGWAFALRAVALGGQLALRPPGFDASRAQKGLTATLIVAGLGLASQALLPPGATGAGFRFPIVWFVMPLSAWVAVICGVVAIARAFQAALAVAPADQTEKTKTALIWLAATALFVVLTRMSPDNKVEVLRGGIALTPTTAFAIVVLAVAATLAMVYAGRATATRGLAKAAVTQTALLAGSIVFGLPFAFLVITSFKEDRDMSSPNGIVWVPKVQRTVPYMDPEEPLFEGAYRGQTVRGTILRTNADGTVRVDITRPLSLRGYAFDAPRSALKEVPKDAPIVSGKLDGQAITGMVVRELNDGKRRVKVLEPAALKDRTADYPPSELEPVRDIGLRVSNYPEALEYLPPETQKGLVYLRNTLWLVVTTVVGTILSSSIVAYAFSRMRFPGRDRLFQVLLSTMMLPGAVTLLPQFLIFRQLGWIDTLLPLWVPAFLGSAFNIFLLRQFFSQIPMELEDAAKIDGAGYLRAFWLVMLPQIRPALAVIAIWTFMGAWNNFMGPLIYVNSPENMPLSYALQLFQGERGGEPGMLMAFATMCMVPVLLLFFFCQRYFIEGVTLSGLGGR